MLTPAAIDALLLTKPSYFVHGALLLIDSLHLAMPEVKRLGLVAVSAPNDADLIVVTQLDQTYLSYGPSRPVVLIADFTAALKRVCGGSNAMLHDAMWPSDLPKGPGF